MKKVFKQQVLQVRLIGLIVYCETEVGQYEKKCKEIDEVSYEGYTSCIEEDGWAIFPLGKNDNIRQNYVVKLPYAEDKNSVVNFCASIAADVVPYVLNGKTNPAMVGRVAEEIYKNLQYEEVE